MTALKTTSLRLRGTDVSVLEEEGLDSEGAVTSKSKLQSKVKALSGVDILTATGEYKSTYEILRDIADVWESINDMDQAALLELISGKRNSSVIAAILQNPEELKAAFEDANNAQGSALKENEKYLDSIQGKIDQFNNAMQAMWSDTLDSDMVKWFVELGTGLIKIIDTIGLIPSILAAILTYKLAIGAIKMFDLGSIGTYISLLFTANNVTEVQGLLINKNALAQKLLNSTLIQAQAARMGLTAADLAGYSVTQLLTLGVKGLAAGFKNLWIAMGPVGWAILAIVAAATIFTVVFNAVHKTTEELAEELADLKTELQDIESEIDALNSELETTQERMAELLAMPSLSFVEQEELDNLKSRTAELERQLELQRMLAESKESEVVEATEKYINRAWDSEGWDKTYALDWSQGGAIVEDKWNLSGVNTKDALDRSMEQYKFNKQTVENYEKILAAWDDSNPDKTKALLAEYGYEGWWNQGKDAMTEYKKEVESKMKNIASGINMVFADENFDDLKYGVSEDIDAFLDELYAYQYKWQEAQGVSAKSSAIASIFDDTSSDSIKKLKEGLTEIAGDDTLDAAKKQENALNLVNKAINSTSGEYDRLKTSMDIIGITADEVARYFTQLSEAPDSSTVEGLTAQYQSGIEALNKYHGKASDVIAEFTNLDGNVEQITWGSLFKDGETIDTQISKVLQGADETTRTEFARIVKAVNEGTMSVEAAMSSFSGSGLVAVSKLIEESFGELNKSVFKGLENEISGFIDTFSEFSAALEDVASSMDLLHTAQEQYNNSGQVSVKTALELMQSTDQWNKILTVENGKITLNAEAQDILVQSKLNTVKANLAEAKASIQNQLAQLGAADATLMSAEASDITTEAYTIYTNAMNSYTASIAGFGAALDALVNGRIFGDDGVIGSFKSAYDAAIEVKTYENNTNISALREKLAEVETMEDFFESVDTFDEFANNYDFDKTPGDKRDDYESAEDIFQREMDYWENRISANQARYEQLQNEIDLLETKGQKADVAFYQEQIKLESQRKSLLEEQKEAAKAYLSTVAEGSEEWWEAANTLNDIESELDDVTASIVDLQDAIGEIDAYKFEEFNTRLDNLISKLGTIRDLIAPDGEEDWFSDEGDWTEAGVAVLGTHIQELATYKQGYQNTIDELAKYQPEYKGNESYYEGLGIHSEQEYYDKTEELISQQYDYAESISGTQQSIVDMYENSIDAVEEYTETLIEGYSDYIDSVKEALDAERSLYDFKKNVQKQAKDIAEMERRISSLSGSTNASDIAERRKLEAQLYEARESLNDTYYDHAKDAQDEALDNEQTAYEESMTKFVEGLRTSLEEATRNMDEFLMGVTSMVMYNAETVLAKYDETNLPLTEDLTNPWEEAKKAVGNYSGDALDLMNQWTKEGGFFAQFNETGTINLESPWSVGTTAAQNFGTEVGKVMDDVTTNIATNVKTASGELSRLYQQIIDTKNRAQSTNITAGGSDGGGGEILLTGEDVKNLQEILNTVFSAKLQITGVYDSATKSAVANAQNWLNISPTGRYDKNTREKMNKFIEDKIKTLRNGSSSSSMIGQGIQRYEELKRKLPSAMYAKGTLGITRDEWAITDESWIGEEITLAAGKNGQLQYLKKGSAVMPADISANLVEWGKIDPSMLNLTNPASNINMITNTVNKPEINLSFEALVKAERIDEGTLPEVKRFVQQEINSLVKQMNYAIKGKGGR